MSIRKRTWTAPDGSTKTAWLCDYRDQTGKRRAKQFALKKAAEAWATNARAEVQRGIHTPDSTSITIEAAAKIWLDTVRANGREPTTIAAYDQHVRLHIVPKCGATKLSQLTAPKVRAILDEWMMHQSRPMALRLLRSLKAIITEAQERGLVAQNVALAVKPRKMSREKPKAIPPTKADLRAILLAAEKADPKARALVELAIFTGLRASELRGLTWSSIDLKRARLTVSQRADAQGTIGPPKSEAGHRTIPLPPRAVTALKTWKKACPQHELDLVFPSEKGRPLSHRVMTISLVGPVQIAAGTVDPLPKDAPEDAKPDVRYGMHAFRHAAASLWIEQGLNPKRVQALMGHSSIQMTFDTYGHLLEEAQKDAQDAGAIERALFADAT
ncbi:tyrosine-type recombinase/integrase [Novosphingobium sp.]|uniref:tyrosine-type recombinase/integrase n=1 Tax=Novosphingobium sp. TaxID=1874826 RepID=UPI002FDDCB61